MGLAEQLRELGWEYYGWELSFKGSFNASPQQHGPWPPEQRTGLRLTRRDHFSLGELGFDYGLATGGVERTIAIVGPEHIDREGTYIGILSAVLFHLKLVPNAEVSLPERYTTSVIEKHLRIVEAPLDALGIYLREAGLPVRFAEHPVPIRLCTPEYAVRTRHLPC